MKQTRNLADDNLFKRARKIVTQEIGKAEAVFQTGGHYKQIFNQPLSCQIDCGLLNFSSASIFKVLQYHSKFVKRLLECQTAWICLRHGFTTQCLIQI